MFECMPWTFNSVVLDSRGISSIYCTGLQMLAFNSVVLDSTRVKREVGQNAHATFNSVVLDSSTPRDGGTSTLNLSFQFCCFRFTHNTPGADTWSV